MSKKNWRHQALKALIQSDTRSAGLLLESLETKDAVDALYGLTPADAAACLSVVEPGVGSRALLALPREFTSKLLESLPAQAAVDFFLNIPQERRTDLASDLSEERRSQLQELSAYPQDSAGRIMSTQFAAFTPQTMISEVVRRLRILAKHGITASYVYVVDENDRLLGVVNLRDLIIAERSSKIQDIELQKVTTVSGFSERADVIELAISKRYLAIPVVDAQGRLIGVVRTATLIESGQDEIGDDLQMVFGGGKEERVFSPFWEKLGHRLPWLNINLLTAFLAASVVALFEDIISKAAVLAVFLPVVAGQGGNAGTQTLAVVLRAIIMREVNDSDAWRILKAEALLGIANGAAIGLVTGAAAWAWKGNIYLGLITGLAMIVNLFAAGAAGAAIPLLMKRWGFDPAQSSGIFLTTVTDVVGFVAFLGFAVLFAGRMGL